MTTGIFRPAFGNPYKPKYYFEMAIPPEEVRHMAELARLRFSPEELKRMAGELEAIVDYIRKLDELDTSSVEPLFHVHEYGSVEREDSVSSRIDRSKALEGAPDADDKYFRVPKVIE